MKKLWMEQKWVRRGCVVLPLLVLFTIFCLWFFREQPILYGDKDSYYASHITEAYYYGKVKMPAANGGSIRKDMSAYADEIIAILADGRCQRVSFDPNARVSRWNRFDEEWTIASGHFGKGFFLWLGGGTPACLRYPKRFLGRDWGGAWYTVTNSDELIERLDALVAKAEKAS